MVCISSDYADSHVLWFIVIWLPSNLSFQSNGFMNTMKSSFEWKDYPKQRCRNQLDWFKSSLLQPQNRHHRAYAMSRYDELWVFEVILRHIEQCYQWFNENRVRWYGGNVVRFVYGHCVCIFGSISFSMCTCVCERMLN